MIRAVPFVLGAWVTLVPAASAASPLDTLVAEVAGALGENEAGDLAAVETALREYLQAGGEPGLRPHPGLDVTTYMLHTAADGSFSIAALVIRPGAATPIHDHDTWTVWGTLEGRDRELRYVREGDGRLPALVAAREIAAGSTSRVPGPPDDLHRVENAGEGDSVSIHVHGADMTTKVRRAYHPGSGRAVSFVQSYVDREGDPR